jgi:hypothetical protein
MALVAIQVCGYQLLRRNDKGDFERSSSGVVGGTDDQPFQSPIVLVQSRAQAVRMALQLSGRPRPMRALVSPRASDAKVYPGSQAAHHGLHGAPSARYGCPTSNNTDGD